MKKILISLVCLFIMLAAVSCKMTDNVQIGKESYYLLARQTINQVDDSIFTNAKLDSAKLYNTVIIIPRFKYAGLEDQQWKYHLVLEVYTLENTIGLDNLTVDLILQQPTGTNVLLAEENIDRFVIDDNNGFNNITQGHIWFKNYVKINDSILKDNKSFTLLIRCSLEGKEKELEYAIDVYTSKANLIDYLYE